METNKEKALNDFLTNSTPPKDPPAVDPDQPAPNSQNNKKVVIDEREGLIERVDKVLVTKDGKQLLREQY
jgi:hypothetical protein